MMSRKCSSAESKGITADTVLSVARAAHRVNNGTGMGVGSILLLCTVLITFLLGPAEAFSGTTSFTPALLNFAPGRLQHRVNIVSYSSPSAIFAKPDVQEEEEVIVIETTQDESVSSPASVVYYDDLLTDPDGVVCAHGLCVVDEMEHGGIEGLETSSSSSTSSSSTPGTPEKELSIFDKMLNSYLGPRALLAFASILYGTNFPLGTIMNESLPPSAATSARMVLASVALSPFLFKLDKKLAGSAMLCGCFTALGYTTQSLALVDLSPATVAFLGAATVVVCPTLEYFVDNKPMGIRDSPQTWLAATLCLVGVGVLELYDPTGATSAAESFGRVGYCDILAVLQAIGFGTSFFLTERMMRKQPDQALPITAVQVSMTALICMLWAISDGWIGQPGSESYGLPAMFMDSKLQIVAASVAWTGLATTALNRFAETSGLGKVTSAEASVILATEPLWAALFAALWLSEDFGADDYIGGTLIVLACLATSLPRSAFKMFLGEEDSKSMKG
jgi:drug/metabolite transporter (DMT)-like permease